MSHFGETALNAGSGGPNLATSTFSNESSGDHALMPYTALAYLASGNADDTTGVFQIVGPANGLPVTILNASIAVTGTFYQATQPISAVSLPLPAGAAEDGTDVTGASMPAGGAGIRGWLSAIYTWLKTQLVFGQGTMAASLPVTIASNQSAVPVSGTVSGAITANAGTNLNTSALALETGGNLATLAGAVSSGKLLVQPTDGTHTMPMGDASARTIHTTVDNASVAVTGTFWQATQPVSLASLPALASGSSNTGFCTPSPAGVTTGATPFKLTACANTTNAANVKNAATTLWEIIAINVGTTPAYLKLYDKASSPTVGTDTPVYVVPLPSQGTANGAGAARTWPTGLKFANGLSYAITGAMGDSDTTAVAANQVVLSGSYG